MVYVVYVLVFGQWFNILLQKFAYRPTVQIFQMEYLIIGQIPEKLITKY